MSEQNAEYVRHVVLSHHYPDLLHDALRIQAGEGFALSRFVPFNEHEFVAVFERAAHIDCSGADRG